jgi:arylsulfatase A-like enzyme
MSDGKQPNVILLTVDCLRADQLGCYGHEPSPAPALDRLAQRACVLEQAVAHGPATRPSMPSLFGSSYPWEYGGFTAYSRERPSVVEELSRQGYYTAAFVPHAWLSSTFGYSRGFVHFDECMSRRNRGRPVLLRAIHHALSRLGAAFLCPPYTNAQVLTDRVLDWLEDAPRPFFLWVHYLDAHWPYNLRRCRLFLPTDPQARLHTAGFARKSRRHPDRVTEQERQGLMNLYRSGIRFVSEQMDRVVKSLRARGSFDDTMIIVTADHGEAFGEHGYFYHGRTPYEEKIRVPLLVKLPGQQEGYRIAGGPACLMDIAPTVLEAVGLPHCERFRGKSMLPSLSFGRPLPEREAICEGGDARTRSFAIRTLRSKGIVHLEKESLEIREVEWYDLENDPGEQQNRADERPDIVSSLCERVLTLAQGMRPAEMEEPEVEPEVIERLRALGYIED